MNVSEFQVDVERIEAEAERSSQVRGSAIVLPKLFLGNRPVKQCNRQSRHFKRPIEARTRFRMAVEFLVLNAEVVVRFRIGRIFFDLLQTEREIEPLLGGYTLFTANFPI